MARNLVGERFGHPFTIALQIRNQINRRTSVKAIGPLRIAFADQLKDCEHTLESIGYLDEINSVDNLRGIVQRLQFHLRTKFIEVAE